MYTSVSIERTTVGKKSKKNLKGSCTQHKQEEVGWGGNVRMNKHVAAALF